MNWIFSFLFLPLIAGNFFSAELMTPRIAEEIVWSKNRKLSWDDFKSAPGGGRLTGAVTYASIKTIPKVVNYWNNKIEVEVKAVFRCDKSWAKEQAKASEYLLNHEQRHFDIAAIFAGKIRRELQGYKVTAKNYPQIKAEIIEKWFEKYDAYDRSYDKLTVHGLDKQAQEKWNQEIDIQLSALENELPD